MLQTNLPGGDVGGRSDVASRRKELETAHPDRRDLASSKRTLAVQFSLEHLAGALEELEDITERVEIWDWSRRRARVFVRLSKGTEPMALPANAATNALECRPLIDGQIVHWPQWAQTLKSELDPHRHLVTGP